MSDYIKYRGKCKELAEQAVEKDPSLTLVRGHYYDPIENRDHQHWWTEKPDGTIFDPSVRQFRCTAGVYTPFNGIVKCSHCGKQVAEEDAQFASNYAFCSDSCHMRFVGL